MRLLTRFCAFLSIAVSFALAADMPSGASLLQRYIDRSGGAEAYAKAKNMVATGAVELAGQNISGAVTIFEEGEKSRTAMEFPGIGKVEEGFDGETAWENSVLQGPRILEGDEKTSVVRGSTLALVASWREIYKDVRTVGVEDVDGKPAWKVEMTPVEMTAKDGKPETFFFDKDSGMLVRISQILSTPLGDIAIEATMSDFRMVEGILTPFTMTEKALSQNIVMRLDKIAYNAAIPPDRFTLPAEVKALLDKNDRTK